MHELCARNEEGTGLWCKKQNRNALKHCNPSDERDLWEVTCKLLPLSALWKKMQLHFKKKKVICRFPFVFQTCTYIPNMTLKVWPHFFLSNILYPSPIAFTHCPPNQGKIHQSKLSKMTLKMILFHWNTLVKMLPLEGHKTTPTSKTILKHSFSKCDQTNEDCRPTHAFLVRPNEFNRILSE